MTRQRTTIPLLDARRTGASTALVEEALRRTKGVLRAVVNPATEMAYVEFDAEQCTATTLESVVSSLNDSDTANTGAPAQSLTSAWRWRIIIAVIGVAALVTAVILHAVARTPTFSP